ncbi:MAG: putative lipid II flippase FtsW [Verrucomicrobia bacterium]|nr:putative lipid II flippase FtsW [Verrucomicrobiota bacterium]
MKYAATILVGCVGSLLALGMVMLYSASMGKDGAHYLLMQLAWGGLGLAACVAAAALDYRHLKKISGPLLVLSLVLLGLVLVPGVGTRTHGASRWFRFHGLQFQPSELAKLALVIALAHYGERRQWQMRTFLGGVALPGLMIGATLGLIFEEPDWGSTILLATVSVALLLLAGARWTFLVPPVLLGTAGLGICLWHNPTRIGRVMAFLHPEQYKDGVGYQAYQAMIALGSGGWTGLGLGNGRQKLGFVPEQHTDFILSIIGEELGLVTTLAVAVAFVVLVLCGLYLAWRAREPFGFLLAVGVTLLIGLQALINIGVVTSALPNKGLPLPFISYGGSNLVAMLTCVGLLLSVARRASEPETAEAADVEDNVVTAVPAA